MSGSPFDRESFFSSTRRGFLARCSSRFIQFIWGSASGALGITGFVGTVAVSSTMGGVGAALGGARTTEDILFGMAAGALVWALNFAEHEIEEKTLLDKAIVAAGFNDPSDAADWTDDEVTANMAKIFPEMYKAANNPKFELTDIINNNNPAGEALKNVSQYVHSRKYVVTSLGKILLQRGVTSSIRLMASVAGHELNHMIDYVSGTYLSWINKYNPDQAHYRSETKAYDWERDMGSPFFNPAMFEHFNSLIK